MKHPSPEEWVEFMNGETPPETREKLVAHLQECETCAGGLESWDNVVSALPKWTVPEPDKIVRPRFGGVPWPLLMAAAVIAALALVAGLTLAGLTRELHGLRNEVVSLQKKTEPAEPVRYHAELAELQASMLHLTEAYRQVTNDLQRTIYAVSEVNRANHDALLEFAAAEKIARDQNQTALAQMIQEAEYREQNHLALLRKDLETVASMADDQLQLTRQNLIRISASAKTNHH